jgi:hypothetical protein
MPCSYAMLSKKTRATVVAVYGCASEAKCAYLEKRSTKRSTTVSTTVLPLTRGKPSMKFIATSAHIDNGTSRG